MPSARHRRIAHPPADYLSSRLMFWSVNLVPVRPRGAAGTAVGAASSEMAPERGNPSGGGPPGWARVDARHAHPPVET
jgi:hypothetical protein